MSGITTFDAAEHVAGAMPDMSRRRRRADQANIDSLRERVREIGLDIERNWQDVAPQKAAPEVSPAPALERSASEHSAWANDLADEYRQDFAMATPARAVAEPVAERHFWADAFYAFGALLYAADTIAGPAVRAILAFMAARRALVLKVLLVVLLALAVQGVLRDWPKSEATAPASSPAAPVAPVWVDIARPYPLFELSAPLFGHEKPLYAARRHVSGGGREDILTFGEFGGDKPWFRLSVYRHGVEEVSESGYVVETVRIAAASGLSVAEPKVPQALATRFGAFESGALELSGPKGAKRSNCRAFRLEVAAPALTMRGLACGAADDRISPAEVACVIDHLDLLAAGQDRALADFFGGAAGKKSQACAEARRK